MRTRLILACGLAGLVALSAGCTKNKSKPESSKAAATEEPAAAEPAAAEPAAAEPAAAEPAKTEAPAVAPGTKPVVQFSTSMGDFKVELYPDKAPKTVANFLAYVKSGHYKGTIFHRVIPGFMVQGGGFDPAFNKKETRPPIQNEADNGLKNTIGTLAMARTPDPHSASAQFFVNVANNPFLDHKDKTMRGWGYCVFGKVIDGMDVVQKMAGVTTGEKGPFSKDAPQEDIVIKDATLLK
jgi:peptidyl-prolyl cis-trans isomerase A (cyclophilin A)/peptidyl-prolyl cis-trans isomerase B (cyclophilin B)